MRPGPNRELRTNPGQSLPKPEILRGRRNFERLFKRSTLLKSTSVHLRYRLYSDPEEGCAAGFVAAKRLGTAVSRNRVRRRMREVYRIHRDHMQRLFDSRRFGLHALFFAQSTDIDFHALESEMTDLIEQLCLRLEQRYGAPVGKTGSEGNTQL
ncbi:MAG: ribonuclease P protein component [Balneolaceae bacterium]